jgi:hypothetical protein
VLVRVGHAFVPASFVIHAARHRIINLAVLDMFVATGEWPADDIEQHLCDVTPDPTLERARELFQLQ